MERSQINYEILNKIIIQGGAVYVSGAMSDKRPLEYSKREEAVLTDVFQKNGLHGLLTYVLREVYRGRYHLRNGSKITRALRESIHVLPLDQIRRIEEEVIVNKLADLAEVILKDPDHDLTEEIHALRGMVNVEGDSPANTEFDDFVIQVNLFGQLEIKNQWGKVTESKAKQSLPWNLLKYLLMNPGNPVSLEELIDVGVWPEDGDEVAVRVRLRRLREALQPLHLDGKRGLILYRDGKYSINPKYIIKTDADEFLELVERIKRHPIDDPAGLLLVDRALGLFQGNYMAQTEDAPWVRGYQDSFKKAFSSLAYHALERILTQRGDAQIKLLCLRSVELLPEEEALHKGIIQYLVDRKQTTELMRHITSLNQSGKADWLSSL